MDIGDDRLWIGLRALAERKGCTPRAIQKRVARLQAEGMIEVRRRGRQKFVNLAEFDRAVGEIEDPAQRLSRALAPEPNRKGNRTYQAARADKERYSVELARLELQEKLNRLRPVDEIADALATIGGEITRSADALAHARAEQMYSAAMSGDLAAFRDSFRRLMHDWAVQASSRIAELADDN